MDSACSTFKHKISLPRGMRALQTRSTGLAVRMNAGEGDATKPQRKFQVSGLRPFGEQRAGWSSGPVTHGINLGHGARRAATDAVGRPSSATDKELMQSAIGPVIEEMTKARARTDFVAETLLPTMNGEFRVRAYRHWVRVFLIIFSRSASLALGTRRGYRQSSQTSVWGLDFHISIHFKLHLFH